MIAQLCKELLTQSYVDTSAVDVFVKTLVVPAPAAVAPTDPTQLAIMQDPEPTSGPS